MLVLVHGLLDRLFVFVLLVFFVDYSDMSS